MRAQGSFGGFFAVLTLEEVLGLSCPTGLHWEMLLASAGAPGGFLRGLHQSLGQ